MNMEIKIHIAMILSAILAALISWGLTELILYKTPLSVGMFIDYYFGYWFVFGVIYFFAIINLIMLFGEIYYAICKKQIHEEGIKS